MWSHVTLDMNQDSTENSPAFTTYFMTIFIQLSLTRNPRLLFFINHRCTLYHCIKFLFITPLLICAESFIIQKNSKRWVIQDISFQNDLIRPSTLIWWWPKWVVPVQGAASLWSQPPCWKNQHLEESWLPLSVWPQSSAPSAPFATSAQHPRQWCTL